MSVTRCARLAACVVQTFLVLGACAAARAADGPAPAGPPSSVPVEQFFQHAAVAEARLSPSGTRVAFVTYRASDHRGLFVVDLGDQPKGHHVAQFSDADVVNVRWLDDDRLLYSAVDLLAGSGESYRFAPGLYMTRVSKPEQRRLIDRQGKQFFVSGQERHPPLEWNHELLLVPRGGEAVERHEVLVGEQVFSGGSLREVIPRWLNVDTMKTRHIDLDEAPDHAVAWWFNSRGEPRALKTSSEGREAYWWHGPADKDWRRLVEGEVFHLPFSVWDVDDADQLYVRRSRGARGEAVLARYDFQAQAPEKTALVSAPGFDVNPTLLMENAGGRALGVRVNTDAEQTLWQNPTMKAFQAEVDQKLPGTINRVSCVRCGASDMVALVYSYSDRDPGRYYVYEAQSKIWHTVGATQPGIDPRQMATVSFERIKARDGQDLPVWLTLPQGVSPGHRAPAVVLVHGGPHMRGDYWQWNAMQQFLASRGYLVISPEYRGSTGFGFQHFKAGWGQWGQAMQNDVADALLWAQAQGLASDKACIAGASYGGYATLMGLVRHPALYRCGVEWVGVSDLELFVKGSFWVDTDISDEGRHYSLRQIVGDPDKDIEMIRANSPVLLAAQIKAPLLMAYGESDRRVPLAHGKRMREALIAAGNAPEWVTYDDEGHGWRKVENQIDFARRVEAFLARYLKDAPATPVALQH